MTIAEKILARAAMLPAVRAGVVAVSFAPQFFRHAIGHGLLVARCPAELYESLAGPRLRVDFVAGSATDCGTGQVWDVDVPGGPARDIVAAGGLVPFLRARLASS